METSGDDVFDVVITPGVSGIGLTGGCYTMGHCEASADVIVFDTHDVPVATATVDLNSNFDNFLGISSDVQFCCVVLTHQSGENQEQGHENGGRGSLLLVT